MQGIFLSNSQRVDIIFDVNADDSIKEFEKDRRSSGSKSVEIEISQDIPPFELI